MECAPAFNYARDAHTTSIVDDPTSITGLTKAVFDSEALKLELRYLVENTMVGHYLLLV